MKKIWLFAFLSIAITSCHENLDQRCTREAKEYTEKYCPAPIAEGIMIDSMTFESKTHTLHYYYSLTGKIDDINIINHNSADMRRQLLKSVDNATNLKQYKDAGFSFAYTYFSSKNKGQALYSCTITNKDYNY